MIIRPILILLIAFLLAAAASAQRNLLLNPTATTDQSGWRAVGAATIEEFDGKARYVIRNRGSFYQNVLINEKDAGKYVLLVGEGSSERINLDGSITGLPYLYGYMTDKPDRRGNRIYAYLQGQQTLGRTNAKDSWVRMYGIFRIVEKTQGIDFFLNQAERKDSPQNGSAARFDNLGLYIFDSEGEAKRFVEGLKF